ncbi:MAG: diaminopimelate epimerase [Candidatus Zixiibacteriota bacterium]
MQIQFTKYHALQNDFLVIEQTGASLSGRRLSNIARTFCHRRTGAGADGILVLSKARGIDYKVDIYNADGSWAEKSGNGLRIAGVHVFLKSGKRQKSDFLFRTGAGVDRVQIGRKIKNGYLVTVDLGRPEFDTSKIPVKTSQRYMINAPLKVGTVNLPVTCLSVGNPHTVLFVDNFDFDWKALGADLEVHKAFPNRTNVEFVKVVTPREILVCDWERGAGATGSSGTGAAASACAGVMLGLVDRRCEVVFDTGSLDIHWIEKTDTIRLTGPVVHVTQGTFQL